MNITKVKQTLTFENTLYRAGLPTSVTDPEWDDLLEQLQAEISVDEYNQFRSTLTESGGKVKHNFIIGSLSKTKADEDDTTIFDFVTNRITSSLFATAKIDGASMVVKYVDGNLVSAATRGDGYFGEDQLNKMVHVIKPTLAEAFTGEIRGEVVLTSTAYENLNQDGKYKHPRNALVGIINRKEVDVHKLQYVSFVAYNILTSTDEIEAKLIRLEQLGFIVPLSQEFSEEDITPALVKETLTNCYSLFNSLSPYAIDGLVVSDIHWKNEAEFLPKGCVAFKVNDVGIESKVVKVNWELSKNGFMIPIVQIVPIEIDGSTVTNPTGYNYRYIYDNDIGVGSIVSVIKSGDIIPKIVSVQNDSTVTLSFPISCPSCGLDLVEEGVHIRCTNELCTSQIQQRTNHFARKMGVEGASLKSLQSWNIITIHDLINFKPDPDSKSQQTFYNELDKIFTAAPEKLFANMHWEGWGSKTVTKLINHVDFDTIVNSIYTSSFPAGLTAAGYEKSFRPFQLINRDYLLTIRSHSRYSYIASTSSSNAPLIDTSFCFTGKMAMKRRELEALVIENGGEVRSVSKNLTYLVTNTPDSGSGKNKKAATLGVKLITEAEFMLLI